MKMTEKGKDVIFQTRDINLAAYLKVKGYELRTATHEGNRVIFGFVDKQDQSIREQEVYDFYNNEGEFLAYTDAWKNLKSFLHNMPQKSNTK